MNSPFLFVLFNHSSLLWQGAILWILVVLVAFVVGRFAPQSRTAMRRVVVPALLVTLLAVSLHWVPAGSPSAIVGAARHAYWLILRILLINAVGLLIFVVLLPRFASLSKIAHELSIGVAYIVLIFFFLRRVGLDFSSLLATSAVVTAIVAISMQATLGNAFGGLTLQLDQSVGEGDWVRLDDGTEGLVRAVRWRHTVIETRNWDTIIVPNSLLMAQKFMLLGRREGQPSQRRMWVYFNVDFRFAPAHVIDVVQESLRSAPIFGAASAPPPNCACMDLVQQDSSIRYAVRYWLTDLAADDPTSSLVRARIYTALLRAKIPLAIPAQTLFIENQDEESSERKAEKKLERRLEAVRRMPLCRELTTEEQARVAQTLRYSPYAAGEVISREGAPARWLYILDKGTVEIRSLREDKDVAVASLTAPDYFGEHGMLTGSPRTASVVASSEVECFRLDRATFQDLLRSRPEIAHDVAAVLAQRQEDLARSLENLEQDGDRLSRDDRHLRILSRMQEFFGLSSSK